MLPFVLSAVEGGRLSSLLRTSYGKIIASIAALLPPELRGAHADDAPDAQVQLPRHVSQDQMEQ